VSVLALMCIGELNAQTTSYDLPFHEGFSKCDDGGGNDGNYDGGKKVAVNGIDPSYDNDGWTVTDKVQACSKRVRLATKKNPGTLTSPALNFTGDATLMFVADGANTDNATLKVTLVNGGANAKLNYGTQSAASISIQTTALDDENPKLHTRWIVTITGVTDSGCQIQFSAETDNRVFLDKIDILKASTYQLATSIEAGVPYLIVAKDNAKAMIGFTDYDKKKDDTAITLVDKKKKSDNSTIWSVTMQSDNTVDILSKKDDVDNRYLRYQEGDEKSAIPNTFEAYKKGTEDGISLVSLYKLVSSQEEEKQEVKTIDVNIKTKEGYATLFTDKAFTLANNLQAGIVTGVKDGLVVVDWAYKAGEVIPASLPVLIREVNATGLSALTTAKTYTCNVTIGGTEPDEDNLLTDTLTDQATQAPDDGNGDDYKFYRLSHDKEDYAKATLGFFYGDAPSFTGAAFTNNAGLCYLALPATTVATANSMGFPFSGNTNSIKGVEQTNAAADAKVYTIDGRLASRNGLGGLAKGLYIMGGRKVIVK